MSIITEALNFVILDSKVMACTIEAKYFKVFDRCELKTYDKNVKMCDIKRNKKC